MEILKGEFDIGIIKRLYFGAILRQKCPVCGNMMERDFNDDYLFYPEIGKIEDCYLRCPVCEENGEPVFLYSLKIKVAKVEGTVKYYPKTLKPG